MRFSTTDRNAGAEDDISGGWRDTARRRKCVRQSNQPSRSKRFAFKMIDTLNFLLNIDVTRHETPHCPLFPPFRQLSDRITNDLKLKLLDVCGNDVECDLVNFDPVCEDDLSSSKSLDNGPTRRRRRRYMSADAFARNGETARPIESNPESSLDEDRATRLKRRRERIEIRFKFVGKRERELNVISLRSREFEELG